MDSHKEEKLRIFVFHEILFKADDAITFAHSIFEGPKLGPIK
mgnify:CR=1 FL=1